MRFKLAVTASGTCIAVIYIGGAGWHEYPQEFGFIGTIACIAQRFDGALLKAELLSQC